MSISVAMATYKGEAFIRAQLESIVNQTFAPSEIIICDDRSPDATVDLIRQFSVTSPIPIHLHVNATNMGVIQNFAKAMSLCSGDYIAMADQDDVWHPTKLEDTFKVLIKAEDEMGANTPILAHTDLTLVDAHLKLFAGSMFRFLRLKPNPANQLRRLMIQNTVTGCTVIINRALLQKALPFPPEILMHDHWLALIAAAEGRVTTLFKPTMLYRQHGNNQVGVRRQSLTQRLRQLRKAQNLIRKTRQLELLADRISQSASSLPLIRKTVHHFQKGGLAAVWHIATSHISPSTMLQSGYLILQLMLRKSR